MSLVACEECGGEVSSRARSCPHCGAPTSDSADAGAHRGWAGTVLNLAAVLVSLGIAAAIVSEIEPGLLRDLPDLPFVSSPEWIVEGRGADLGCTQLGDVCAEVSCLVRNVGDAAGTVTVRAVMSSTDGELMTRTTRIRVSAAGERVVSLRFPEVEVGLDRYSYDCQSTST